MSLIDDTQVDIIDTFNTTPRYLDYSLNINDIYFDNIVSQIYPSELQLNKANTFDTEAWFRNCNCPFLIILFLPSFAINVIILMLKLSFYHF